jgi:hypothetical protein
MKSNVFSWLVRIIAVLALAVVTGAWADPPLPEHLSGIISDYTPFNATSNPTGPYEMRGRWSLNLKDRSTKADFTAEMAMELSDYWVSKNYPDPPGPGPVDLSVRGQHTHHITMTDAVVTQNTKICPPDNPVTNPSGLVLTIDPTDPKSVVKITGNGNPAPFESKGPSTLQVCITGGGEVEFANISLVFGGPATGHFGSQAIHGVVRFPRPSDNDDDHRH